MEQILGRLADRFALLAGGAQAALPRHQTLRTTIDWSHDLLDAGERRLLRWLCVFAGRFTLDDVEAACSGDELPVPRALDTLASLVDKSLVTKEDARGTAGYRLHETMREYTGDRERARRTLDEAAEIAAGIDEFPATVAVLQARALHGLFDGDLDAVLTAATEGARRSREAGDLYSLGMMLINQGAATLIAGAAHL